MIPLKRAILDYLLLTCHLWAIMAELILLDSLLKEIPIVYIFYTIHRRIMFFDSFFMYGRLGNDWKHIWIDGYMNIWMYIIYNIKRD